MHKLKIYSSSLGVSPFFVKASSDLLRKYPDIENTVSFTEAWTKEFNSNIVNNFTELEFTSKNKLSLFMFKYL